MKFSEGLVRFLLKQYLAHEYNHEISPHPWTPLCAYEQFHVPVRLLKHSNAFLTQKYVEFYNSAQRQKENQGMAYQKKILQCKHNLTHAKNCPKHW